MKLSKEVQVGLLAVVAMATFYVGFKYLKGINVFRSTERYFVVYDQVDGLQGSNPVWVNGSPIGRVASITLQPGDDYSLLVAIDVRKDLDINENTVAKLGDTGPFGTRAILLEINSGEPLESGSFLKSEKAPGMIDMVQERFDQQVAPMLATFDSTGSSLNRVIQENFLSNQGRIGQLIENIDGLVTDSRFALAENRLAIKVTMENARRLTDSVNTMVPRLNALLANANALSDTVKAMELAHTAATARMTLDTLNAMLADLQAGRGTAGQILKNDSLYANLNRSVMSLDTLLTDFYEYPSRYVHFSVFGKSDEKLRKKAEKKKRKREKKEGK